MRKDEKVKTLLVIDNLHTGGVATSLYNYLKLTRDLQTLDLLVFNDESIDINRIPNGVNIIKPQKILHILGMYQYEMRRESLLLAFIRAVLFIMSRYVNGVVARLFLWPFVKKIGDYDLCIAYAQDDNWKSLSKGCVDFVIKKVNAHKKAVVIHCDYRNFGGYNMRQENAYRKLDYIICVSESCKLSFEACFPNLKGKTIVCENLTDVIDVQKKSLPPVGYDKKKINFVSVCRLTTVKGLDRAIEAFRKLLLDNITNFSWVIVGEGPERLNLEALVRTYGLEHFITFVGDKTNPYPYLKEATWFLLPSRHEAAPMVFGECVSLNIPIITTETCSAKELVEEPGIGIVVNNDEAGIYGGLRRILEGDIKPNSFMIDSEKVNQRPLAQIGQLLNSIKS